MRPVGPDIANLQRKGHAAALTSPEIIAAIVRNYLGCISIANFEWSSAGSTRIVVPWTTICSLKDAEAAALIINEKGDTGFGRRGEAELPFPRPSTWEVCSSTSFQDRPSER